MALTADDLTTLATLAGEAPNARAAAAAIRSKLPGLHASVVDAFDLRGESPVLQAGALSLYLMSCDGHCWSVTGDPAQAGAVVVTESS